VFSGRRSTVTKTNQLGYDTERQTEELETVRKPGLAEYPILNRNRPLATRTTEK